MGQIFFLEIDDLYELLKKNNISRVMLVYDKFLCELKVYKDINSVLDRLECKKIEFTEFEPNPKYESVEKGVKLFEENQCQFIIAAGGGSAIDVAKCIKVYVGLNENRNFLQQEIKANGIQMLAIPTTSGTGSESTQFAVIYYEGEKKSVNNATVLPEYVWLEPETLYTVPPYQKKSTMMDAFCHSVEAMWSVKSNDESYRYAELAIGDIVKYMDEYLKNEPKALKKMMYASNKAGKAINITQTTAGHAMCYKITTLFGLSHGHAAIICLPKLWRYMTKHMDQCVDKRGQKHLEETFNKIASAIGEPTVDDAITKIEALIQKLELSVPKIESQEQMELLVKSVNVERLGNNPVALKEEDLKEIYRNIFSNKE